MNELKYRIIQHGSDKKDEFNSLSEAIDFVAKSYPEFVFNDEKTNENGYYRRYLWGGYREGLELFIKEIKDE